MFVAWIDSDEFLEGVNFGDIAFLALVELDLVVVLAQDEGHEFIEDIPAAFLVPDLFDVAAELVAVFRGPEGNAVAVEAFLAALAVVGCKSVLLRQAPVVGLAGEGTEVV